jgi:hypothetical protein
MIFTQVRFIDWIRQIVQQIVCVCGENNVQHVDTISSPTCSTTCCTTTLHSWMLNYWTAFWILTYECRTTNDSRIWVSVWILRYDRRSVGQCVLEWSIRLGLMTRFFLLSDNCGFVDVGRSLWREDESVGYNCCWPSPAQSFSGSSSVGLATIFYCLRFETSLFVASCDSQGYGGGIRPLLHTGYSRINYLFPFITSGRTAYKLLLLKILLFVFVYSLLRKRVLIS